VAQAPAIDPNTQSVLDSLRGSPRQQVSPRIYEQDPQVYWTTWAHKECHALIRHDPRNCWAHLRQAQLYIEEKKFLEAEESMQKVSRIDPNF
jgi:hypothetical protein